jgi:hypothetical protein
LNQLVFRFYEQAGSFFFFFFFFRLSRFAGHVE